MYVFPFNNINLLEYLINTKQPQQKYRIFRCTDSRINQRTQSLLKQIEGKKFNDIDIRGL